MCATERALCCLVENWQNEEVSGFYSSENVILTKLYLNFHRDW